MKKKCRYPGCKSIQHERYCNKHKRPNTKPVNEDNKFYMTSSWKALSKKMRQEFPVCSVCHKDLSAHADHFIEKSISSEYFHLLPENIVPMCISCHTIKSLKMRKMIASKDWFLVYQWALNNYPREDRSFIHKWIKEKC